MLNASLAANAANNTLHAALENNVLARYYYGNGI